MTNIGEEVVKEFIVNDLTVMILLYKVNNYSALKGVLLELGVKDTGGPFFVKLDEVDNSKMDEFLIEARKSYINDYEQLVAKHFPNVRGHRIATIKDVLENCNTHKILE